MSLTSLLSSRYSCRAYLPQEVDPETIDELFAMAQRTPSWCNTQPWQVHLTSGEATRRLAGKLSAHAAARTPVSDLPLPTSYSGVRDDRRKEAGYGLYSALGIERSDREGRTTQMARNFSFFGAPHTAIVTAAAELGVYGAIDCGAYVATLLLAAEELGLGAIPQGAVAFHSDLLRSELAIPDDQHVVCAVSFGHPDPEHPVNAFRTTRADVGDAVRRVEAPDLAR
jgi:nitroreductase